MQITCPHCATLYVLPESLLGPHGARVRCPRCREPFAVAPDGSIATSAGPGEAAGPAPAPPALATAPAGAADAPPAEPAPDEIPTPAAPPAAARPDSRPESPVPSTPTGAGSAFVSALQRVREALGGGGAAVETAPPAARTIASESPAEVAQAVLGELAAHSGEAIVAAQSQGRLFAEFGAVIAEAYEFYRRRVGPGADPAPFRAALRERWGVDLGPAAPPATGP